MITVDVISKNDDLGQLVEQINAASWDEENEMSDYDAESLAAYLGQQDTVFVACHDITADAHFLLGIASARLEMKPYGQECWLYVDEIDVCVDQRRRGAASAIMRKLFEIAKESDCEEVWLGAEADNEAANLLYCSLEPDEVSQVVGYTYEIDE